MASTTIEFEDSEEAPSRLAQRQKAHADLGGGLTRSDLQRHGTNFMYVISRGGRTVARAVGASAKAAGEDLVKKVGILAEQDSKVAEVAEAEQVDIAASVQSATEAAAAAYKKATTKKTTSAGSNSPPASSPPARGSTTEGGQ